MMDAGQEQVVDAQVAGLLRQMNSITHTTFGRQAPSAPTFARWSSAFVALFDDALADGEAASVELPVAYETIRALIRESGDVLDEVTAPCFVHWDLWDSNVFVDPDTLSVVGVIDFERALWGDPLMEGQFFAKSDDAAIPRRLRPRNADDSRIETPSAAVRPVSVRDHDRRGRVSPLSHQRHRTVRPTAPCADVGEVGPRLTARPVSAPALWRPHDASKSASPAT